MRIEDVRNRLRETEGDCFLDLPRGIGKTTELVKFAIEEEQQGKNVLFVCRNQVLRNAVRNMILRESIGTGNEFNPVEDRRVGNIFLEIGSRRRGSTRIETNFDVAIFDEYTHMDEDDINSFRLFCRRLVGLGTSRMMEENMERNNTDGIRYSPIIEEELGIHYITTDEGGHYTTSAEQNSNPEEMSKTDKYLVRLGIIQSTEQNEDNRREGDPRATISREVGENIWSIL